MYSTVLHNAEDKAIGRKAVGEVLGLGMGPGISGCSYFNYINENCKLPSVELSEIPDECTSLVVKRFFVDLNYHVAANPSNCEKNKINNLDKVLAFSKPVYVYYGYATQSEWTQVLACEVCDGGTNSLDEMKGLKAFFNEHPGITGVILSAFEHNEYSTEFPGFSENLKKYIEVMKSSFPGLEVGIQFDGQFLIDQYTNPQIPWEEKLDSLSIVTDAKYYEDQKTRMVVIDVRKHIVLILLMVKRILSADAELIIYNQHAFKCSLPSFISSKDFPKLHITL
ncbi:hypothetical protein QTP88_000227 [Uroleucon formosanum]